MATERTRPQLRILLIAKITKTPEGYVWQKVSWIGGLSDLSEIADEYAEQGNGYLIISSDQYTVTNPDKGFRRAMSRASRQIDALVAKFNQEAFSL